MSATLEAEECRNLLRDGVSSALDDGRENAIRKIANSVSLPAHRVEKLMRLEIKRVWADEYNRIRAWHDEWRQKQANILRHKADLLEARTQTRRETPE